MIPLRELLRRNPNVPSSNHFRWIILMSARTTATCADMAMNENAWITALVMLKSTRGVNYRESSVQRGVCSCYVDVKFAGL